jgi:trk system potassium uptake protein TrkA
MRIIIIGAGRGGSHLAATLCREKHDVVVVDQDAHALAELEAQEDVLTIRGNGASPRVLDEAELKKTDVVAALTNRDTINLVACQYAKQLGVPHRVARITNPHFAPGESAFDLQEAGVDLVVSKTGAISNELFNIIQHPGTTEVIDLFDGKAQVIGFRVHMDSPLIRAPLQEAVEPALVDSLRFIAAMRGKEMIIPRGDTRFLIGDDVYMAGRPADLQRLLQWASPEYSSFSKIIIAGGGLLGLTLAQRLETGPSQVILVDRDKDVASLCASELTKALVLCGNALNEEILEEVGFVDRTAFVASTGNDENNIISCLLAEKLGANFTLAQINKPEYLSIIESQSLLDRAVSSYIAMSESVLHFIRGRHIKAATALRGCPGELLETELPAGHKWADKLILDIKLPPGCLIASLLRDGEAVAPTGQTQLTPGDRLLLFSELRSLAKVERLFRR